jgi:hypothetical protein
VLYSVGACGGSTEKSDGGTEKSDGGTVPKSDGGAGNVSEACKKYLSCLLATEPGTYAPALALYGESAACWDTPEQAANCTKACTSEFAKISSGCSCNGSDCTARPPGWDLPLSWLIFCTDGPATCPDVGASSVLVAVDGEAAETYPCSPMNAMLRLSPGKHYVELQLAGSAGAALTTAAASFVTEANDKKFSATFHCDSFHAKPGCCQ